MFIGGVGVAYAANPEATESALNRITNVFVTNWPENQNVTGSVDVNNFPATQNVNITNSSPIPVIQQGGQSGLNTVITGAQKWAYKHVNGTLGASTEAEMNALGQDGWELYFYEDGYVSGYGTWYRSVWRKPLEPLY